MTGEWGMPRGGVSEEAKEWSAGKEKSGVTVTGKLVEDHGGNSSYVWLVADENQN